MLEIENIQISKFKRDRQRKKIDALNPFKETSGKFRISEIWYTWNCKTHNHLL